MGRAFRWLKDFWCGYRLGPKGRVVRVMDSVAGMVRCDTSVCWSLRQNRFSVCWSVFAVGVRVY